LVAATEHQAADTLAWWQPFWAQPDEEAGRHPWNTAALTRGLNFRVDGLRRQRYFLLAWGSSGIQPNENQHLPLPQWPLSAHAKGSRFGEGRCGP